MPRSRSPFTITRGGPALLAQLGGGQPGWFIPRSWVCSSACYWIGQFTAGHGLRRDPVLIAQGPAGIQPGGKVAAVLTGGIPIPVAYPAAGSTEWIPPAIILVVFAVCLCVAITAVARYRRQMSDIRQGKEPLRGRQLARARRLAADPATAPAKISRRATATTISLIALLVGEWFGLIAAVAAMPSSPPSAARIACADYATWAQGQDFAGPSGRDLTVLAHARQEAPPGQLAADLATLAADAQSTIAEHQADALAGTNLPADMEQVNTDCK